MTDLARQIFRNARRIVEDGGDPNPCECGAYCLRCCVAIGKGDIDDQFDNPLADVAQMTNALGMMHGMPWLPQTTTDLALMEAIELLGARDNYIAHTRESALSLLDSLLEQR